MNNNAFIMDFYFELNISKTGQSCTHCEMLRSCSHLRIASNFGLATDSHKIHDIKIHHRKNLPEVSLNRTDICTPHANNIPTFWNFSFGARVVASDDSTHALRIENDFTSHHRTYAVELSRPLDLKAVEYGMVLETKSGKML